MIQDALRVLQPGGYLHFWTDVAEYYETTLQLICKTRPTTGMTLVGPTPVAEPVAAHDFDYRTHFERRCRQNREPVYRCFYIKALAKINRNWLTYHMRWNAFFAHCNRSKGNRSFAKLQTVVTIFWLKAHLEASSDRFDVQCVH